MSVFVENVVCLVALEYFLHVFVLLRKQHLPIIALAKKHISLGFAELVEFCFAGLDFIFFAKLHEQLLKAGVLLVELSFQVCKHLLEDDVVYIDVWSNGGKHLDEMLYVHVQFSSHLVLFHIYNFFFNK